MVAREDPVKNDLNYLRKRHKEFTSQSPINLIGRRF